MHKEVCRVYLVLLCRVAAVVDIGLKCYLMVT